MFHTQSTCFFIIIIIIIINIIIIIIIVIIFWWQKRVALKAFLNCNFFPWTLDFFDLPSYSSEYTQDTR